jgi:hypothetical protein
MRVIPIFDPIFLSQAKGNKPRFEGLVWETKMGKLLFLPQFGSGPELDSERFNFALPDDSFRAD